jgi:anti-anti-sigma factor
VTDSREAALRIVVARPGPGPETDAATVLTLRGNLDLDSAGRLRAALDGLLAAGSSRLVLDLGGLDFCDSIGLSALVDAHRACQDRGGYLRLAAPSPFLARVLGVIGLVGRIPVYDTPADALADEPAGGRPRPPDDAPAR